jgi:DoxX-like protein
MIRIGWVLTWLSALNMMGDSTGKMFFRPAQLVSEYQRLGEDPNTMILVGVLQFTVALVYLIPRTSILGAVLMTGFLGGAEAIMTRVGGSGPFLVTLPLFLGVLAWAGIWLRDERLRELIPLRTPLSPRR